MSDTLRPPLDSLSLLLDRVAASLNKEIGAAIEPWEIRELHLAVLSTITELGPLPQARIAAYLGIEPQSMANLVDDLEKMRLVTRERVPEDRRVWAVTPTANGRYTQKKASREADRRMREMMEGVSDEDQELLVRILMQLSGRGRYPKLFEAPGPE